MSRKKEKKKKRILEKNKKTEKYGSLKLPFDTHRKLKEVAFNKNITISSLHHALVLESLNTPSVLNFAISSAQDDRDFKELS